MPACATCHEVSGGENLNNPKCQDCPQKKAEKAIAHYWETIEQQRLNSEMCEEDRLEYLRSVEYELRHIEFLLNEAKRFIDDIRQSQDSLVKLQKYIDKKLHPKSLDNVLIGAYNNFDNGDTREHRSPEPPSLG